jgi:hypothetical protein
VNSAARETLVAVLKAQRRKLSPAARRVRKRPQRWIYPWATEKHYAAAIRAWVRPMRDFFHEYLDKNKEAVLRGDSAAVPHADSVSATRLDAVPGRGFRLMADTLGGWVGRYISDTPEGRRMSPVYMGLGKIADNVFNFNETQYEKSAKSSLGIEFPSGEDWWADAKENWKRTNYELFRGQALGYVQGINAATQQAVTGGWSVGVLSEKIKALDDSVSHAKANFLARDQIGKLNGEITQRRMEDAGLSMYIWSTGGDERVRESHALMDEGLCRWDDSSVYSDDGGKTWKPRPAGAVLLHPGQDYQCRCTALSYWDELVDEADAKIAEIEGLDAMVAGKEKAMPKTTPPAPAPAPVPSAKSATNTKPQTLMAETVNEKAVNAKLDELRKWGKTSKKEQASMMTQDGKIIGSAKGDANEVLLSGKMMQALDKQPPNSLVLLHNHPNNTSFSATDFDVMCKHGSIKELRVVGSNGKTYSVSVGNGKKPSLNEMKKYEKEIAAKIKQECANKMVKGEMPKGENMFSFYLSERNKVFAEKYGWEYKEGK